MGFQIPIIGVFQVHLHSLISPFDINQVSSQINIMDLRHFPSMIIV